MLQDKEETHAQQPRKQAVKRNAGNSTHIHASRRFNKFLKFTLGRYLAWKYHIRFENTQGRQAEPPYIILANHTNFWDPFMLSHFVEEPICFVTSDEYFHNFLLRNLLKLVGSIPKSKFISDSATVKAILRVKNQGEVIGIFPEGKRNWNGQTGGILFATAKLIKVLKIPVVVSLLQGAHLSWPRWAKKSRVGAMTITYRQVLSSQDIQILNVEEIYQRICSELSWDEYEFQRNRAVAFKGRNLAEYLELYLFVCPHCNAIGQLTSHHDALTCKACGYEVHYTTLGYLENLQEEPCFPTPGEWDAWQLEHLRHLIEGSLTPEVEGAAIFEDTGVTLRRGDRMRPLKKYLLGGVSLYPDKIRFHGLMGGVHDFPLEDLSGLNVQHNNQFEFYCKKVLYRFSFQNGRTSAYKWVKAVQMIRELQGTAILTD